MAPDSDIEMVMNPQEALLSLEKHRRVAEEHYRTCPYPKAQDFRTIPTTRWQQFKATWFGPVYLGHYDSPGWPTHNAMFLDRCEMSDCRKHFVTYAMGQQPSRLECPHCGWRRYLVAARYYRLSMGKVPPLVERLWAYQRTIPPR